LDLRLVLGICLVVGSVAIGSTVVASADKRAAFWSTTHSVAAGTVLRDSDVVRARVQLGSAAPGYQSASSAVVGQVVLHAMGAGQLLARADLATGERGLLIAIPLPPANGPRLSRGDRVTFWLTAGRCHGAVLIGDVTVQDVRATAAGALSSGSASTVLVRVTPAEAQQVVSSFDLEGAVIRAGIIAAGEQAPPRSERPLNCAATG
jgi:hypothetical protein